MIESFRGGNSRLLARQLDLLDWPVVFLDPKSEIVFVSAALCRLVQADATRLVGLSCQAEISRDSLPFDILTIALAPPAEVLHGSAALRQIPWPPLAPTTFATQAFIPLIDDDPSAGLILILFGEGNALRHRMLPLAPPRPSRGNAADEVLLRLRAQWHQLEGLGPLLGTSSGIQLAMRRLQLAATSDAGVLVTGPEGSGKAEIARGLAALRAKTLALPPGVAQVLPIDCSIVDATAAASMLDLCSERLRAGAPPAASHLLLEHIEQGSEATLAAIQAWLSEHGSHVCTVMTSELSPPLLAAGRTRLIQLAHTIGTIEVIVPPLASRREDIAALVQHNLTTAAQRAGRRLPGIAQPTLELLEAYSWPGNLGEMRQVCGDMLSNAVLTATIQPAHLPLQLRTFGSTLSSGGQSGVEAISLDEVLLDLERVMLQRAMKLSPRNRARAARLLGISRPRFLRRISQLGLDDRPNSEEE